MSDYEHCCECSERTGRAGPSTAEIMSVLASHYGVDTGVVALWIHEIKVQEAA